MQRTLLTGGPFGAPAAHRAPAASRPTAAWSERLLRSGRPLPTNAWWQNLALCSSPADCAGSNAAGAAAALPGGRRGPAPRPAHLPWVAAQDTQVQATVDAGEGLTMGFVNSKVAGAGDAPDAPESLMHRIADFGDLSVTLEWRVPASKEEKGEEQSQATPARALRSTSDGSRGRGSGGGVLLARAPLVQGMAYATMEFFGTDTGPAIVVEQRLRSGYPIVDGGADGVAVDCSSSSSSPSSGDAFLVKKELDLVLGGADSRWLVFFSVPTWLACSVDDATGFTSLTAVARRRQ